MTRNIKVAIVTKSSSRLGGGVFSVASSIACHLGGRNVSGVVYSRQDDFSSVDIASWGLSEVNSYHSFDPTNYFPPAKMLYDLSNSDCDLMHVHGLWSLSSVAGWYWRRTSRPLLISPHGMLERWALRNSRLKKIIASALIERWFLNAASCIHALSEFEVEDIRRFGIRAPIAVIPNGVDPVVLDSPARTSLSGRRKLLYLGRIHEKKGIFELVSAWARFQKSNLNSRDAWVLEIVGWGSVVDVQRLTDQIARLEISSTTKFLGAKFGNDKREAYMTSDCFILPSQSEGLPMTVLEAWSYGLPVAISHECNLPQAFVRDSAIHVEPTVDGIYRALVEITATSDSRLRELGINGRSLVADSFDWSVISEKYARLYRWLVGVGERPEFIYE